MWLLFQCCGLVNLVGSFCFKLGFPDRPVFVTPGYLQTLQLEEESLVLLLLWVNPLQVPVLWAAAPNPALAELIMQALLLRGRGELAEILPHLLQGHRLR